MSDRSHNQYDVYGIATFGKTEHVRLQDDWRADVAFLGVPFDLGVGFRSGARFGPKGIRDISVRYRLAGATPGYWDLREERYRASCRIVDCGDVIMPPLDWERCFDRITEDVSTILSRGAMPVLVGGDHAVTFPIIRAYEGRGPITIVHFDAHTDFREDVLGVKFGHGSVMRRCSELSWIKNSYSIGIRSLRTVEADVRAIRERGNVIIPAWEVQESPSLSIIDRLPRGERLYITFDVDCLDAAIAPGTGTPEPGGLTYREVRPLLRALCEQNELVGFDVVELNPSFDWAQVTALIATQIIIEVIGFTWPGRATI